MPFSSSEKKCAPWRSGLRRHWGSLLVAKTLEIGMIYKASMGNKVDSSASPSPSGDAGSVAHHRFSARHLCRASPTGNLFLTPFSNCVSTCSTGMSCPFLSNHTAESMVKPNSARRLSASLQHLGWRAFYRANLCDPKLVLFFLHTRVL